MKKKSIFAKIKKYFNLTNYFGSRVKVFFYHRVKIPTKGELKLNDIIGCPFCISPEVFEGQLIEINNKYKIISLDDFFRNSIPRNAAMLTFDDGYKDFYTNVFPILQKYKIPATIFLIADFVGSEKVFWRHELLNAIFNTRTDSFDGFRLVNDKDKIAFFDYALSELNKVSQNEKEHYIENIKKCLGYKKIASNNLSWSEVNEMKENGVSVGSHTMTHPILTKIPLNRIKEEILNSKIKIEEKIKKSVKAFAYPYGIYDDEIENIVKSAGYSCAFTTNDKTNSLNDDLFALGRSSL